jgi:hypothetical protein
MIGGCSPKENGMFHQFSNYKHLNMTLHHAFSKFMSRGTDLSNRITSQQLEDAWLQPFIASEHTQEGREFQ